MRVPSVHGPKFNVIDSSRYDAELVVVFKRKLGEEHVPQAPATLSCCLHENWLV